MMTTSKIAPPKLPKQLEPIALQADMRSENMHSGDMHSGDMHSGDVEYAGFLSNGANLMHVSAEKLLFSQGRLQNANLSYTRLSPLRLTDVQFTGCDLANADWAQAVGLRVQLSDCRLVGFAANESYWQDLRFQRSICTSAQFRFASFKRATFIECDLRNANFQGSDLSGVRFQKCNLEGVQFSGAKLSGADLRGCSIIDIKIGPAELVGTIVEHFQAAYLASVMGVVIKDEHE